MLHRNCSIPIFALTSSFFTSLHFTLLYFTSLVFPSLPFPVLARLHEQWGQEESALHLAKHSRSSGHKTRTQSLTLHYTTLTCTVLYCVVV